MTWLSMFLARLKGSARQKFYDAELSEELRAHAEMLAEDKQRQGLAPEEARRQARLELGNSTQIQESYRRQAGLPFFEALAQDLRFAGRLLWKSPGFTLVAVVTLALGIGANSAIFSVVNGVLLRPLPFRDPGRLMNVFCTAPGVPQFGASPPDFRALRERNHTLETLSASYGVALNLTGLNEPERVQGSVVSAEYFTTLGVQPTVGRSFLPGEERWGSHYVAIVSEGFWRAHFGPGREIAGKTLTLNGDRYSVIGIMPESFYTLRASQVWLPMAFKPGDVYDSHNNYFVSMVGRLKPGLTQQQARADLNGIFLAIAGQFPENKGISAGLQPLHEAWVGNVRLALLVLLAAVGFVLLIACVNLANLLLARSTGRQKEIAIRSALGASRSRLVRQFVTESVLLGCLGGALGLGIAALVLQLTPLAAGALPRANSIQLDGWVLLFTAALSLMTGLAFGLMPALQNSRVSMVGPSLKEGGRTSASGGRQARAGLVVSEVALTLVLLICSGLAIKSFAQLLRMDAGFDPSHVLTFSIALPDSYDPQPDPLRIGAPPRVSGFFRDLVASIEQLPGVKAAGAISTLPLQGENWGKFFVPLDRPVATSIEKLDHIQYRSVAGHPFTALGIRLVKGRLLDDHDQASGPFSVVVNETLAKRYWPSQDPIGKTVLLTPPESLLAPGLAPPGYHPQQFAIVGVVSDVRYGGLDQVVEPVVYATALQHDFALSCGITVRTDGDPRLLISSVRGVLQKLDHDLPMAKIMTLEEIVSSSVAQPRLQALLLGMFGALAMVLAAIGIYGVMAYSVSQRTSEIGLRMALGASRADVLKMVIGQGMRLAGAGMAVGLALAFAATRLMAGVLYRVSVTDPFTFALNALVLAVIAVLACYLPARRATRVEPVIALRYE